MGIGYFFLLRGEEIKKVVVARKEGDGLWAHEKHVARTSANDNASFAETTAAATSGAPVLPVPDISGSANLNQVVADIEPILPVQLFLTLFSHLIHHNVTCM